MANGIADNLLLTSYLSAKCKVFFAPAMDLDMYAHPAVQKNMQTLVYRGDIQIEAECGFLASGLEGKGRMAEPKTIVETIEKYFAQTQDLQGKVVMVTAGPTYEKIDPVRFIGNYSSGKMGYSLAEECAERGAKVLLISGPVSLSPKHANIQKIPVESAKEMYEAAVDASKLADIEILCAAVADYTPATRADHKIKREKTGEMTIDLLPTKDIAAELGRQKREGQLMVGFALETDDEEVNAKDKCARKNLDFIVMNSLKDKNACFQHNTNKITIFDKDGTKIPFDLKDKKEVAKDIVNHIVEKMR